MTCTEALWRQYKQQSCPDARQALITQYVHLAKYVVDRLSIRASGALSTDDLVGYAVVGLIDAVERYDPDRGAKFETYAIARIRGTIMDSLRSLDWVPRSVRRMERTVRDCYARLEGALHRSVTDEEVAEELGMSVDEFQSVLIDIGQSAIFSLEDCLQAARDPNSPALRVELRDDAPGPDAQVEAAEQKRMLAEAVGHLPERDRLVVSLYYYDGLTLKQIGGVLGVSEARVSQIHTRAVLRLRAGLERLAPVFCG